MRARSTPALRTLLTGLVLGESPRWHQGRLWLCDWGARRIVAVDPEGEQETILRLRSFPFCIDWLPDGRLLVVSGTRVLRLEPDGTLATHAELRALSRHRWNEIAVDDRGDAYVNCVNFAFPGGRFKPGLIARVTPDGRATLAADGLGFPNGMALSRDRATLIVAESFGQKLTAFDLRRRGGLAGRRTWAELPGAAPDGICVDAQDAVWYADVPNQRCVRVREGGAVDREVVLDRGCFSCTLGGGDGRDLFLVAARWPAAMEAGSRTGQVLVARAPSPAAERTPGKPRGKPRPRQARAER